MSADPKSFVLPPAFLVSLLKLRTQRQYVWGIQYIFGAKLSGGQDWTRQKAHLLWLIQLLPLSPEGPSFLRLDTQELLVALDSTSHMNMAKVRNGPTFIIDLRVFSANLLVSWHIIKNKNSLQIIYNS